MKNIEDKQYENFDLNVYKGILKLAKPHKKNFILLLIYMVICASLEATFPIFNKYAIDNFIVTGDISKIYYFGAVFVFMVFLLSTDIWLFIEKGGRLEMDLMYEMRKEGFKRLQELSFSYYDKNSTGWLVSRITSDVHKLGEVFAWGFVDMIWGITSIGIMGVVMIFLNWKLGLLAFSVIPVLVWISILFQKRILSSYRKVRKINSRITSSYSEGISGAQTTKTLCVEPGAFKEFQIETTDMYSNSVKAAVLSAFFLPIVITVGSAGTALVLYYGGYKTMLSEIGFGTFVAIMGYTLSLIEPVITIARIFAEMQHAQASAERLISLIDSKPEIDDSDKVKNIYGDILNHKRENWEKIEGNISFKNVTFSYKDGETVLKNFSLDVKKGEKIALVGETGSGKSTIVNLACRFYEPTAGQILIDSEDYRNRSVSWLQSNLGYVLQKPHLFSGTISENIAYGKLDAKFKEIEEAAKKVNAHEFIMKFAKGYDTETGEGGNLLSTGQKQLISFARAILANPRIFILDEATSSVDTETEMIIQEAINKTLHGRTSFIIAHRLSTVKNADRILVLKDGLILENGTHHSLLKLKGYYYKLYTNQFVEEHENVLLNS